MKRGLILAIALLLVILIGLTVVVVTDRVQELPSMLTIRVTFYYLSRNGNQSYSGGQNLVSMELTTTNETADNVTLVPPPFSNKTIDAYWRLQIVLNDSAITVAPWKHDIEASNHTAGEFSGTVSKSFTGLDGNFTVWIVLWSVHNGSITMLWWTSETIRIY